MKTAEKSVGERLKAWLDRHELTQDAFADDLGISGAHLSQIISGSRKPSLTLAADLEARTGIPSRDWAQVA